ncbi:MAG: cupin domain-containing protein [Gammaproteobacteria bacterium]|nr:cupin domain-containing protein [Gammaproteobacteria bacterium]MCP5136160.1 cupin domain-containing protein [Gammaproteobacteria bacterium]
MSCRGTLPGIALFGALFGTLLSSLLSVPIHAQDASVQSPLVALPDAVHRLPEWSEAELAQAISVRPLNRSAFASTHLIRLQGREQPHFHDQHDLAITLLHGKSVLHFAERDVALHAGDTAFIPRGTYHWAENTDVGASVVFAVFAPPFDGMDRRPAVASTP